MSSHSASSRLKSSAAFSRAFGKLLIHNPQDADDAKAFEAIIAALQAIGGLDAAYGDFLPVNLRGAAATLAVQAADEFPAVKVSLVKRTVTVGLRMAREVRELGFEGESELLLAYDVLGQAAEAVGIDVTPLMAAQTQDSARERSARSYRANASREADKEARAANVLRLSALIVLGGSFTATLFGAFVQASMSMTLSDIALDWLVNAAVFVPLVILVGYLARESAQHRHVSRELQFKAIQMQNAADFAEALPEDRRGEFLQQLGQTMFATPFNQPGRKVQSGLPADQFNSHVTQWARLARAMKGKR